MTGPSYTDEEGNIMYGYSQVSLDANTEAVNKLVTVNEKRNKIYWGLLALGFIVVCVVIYIIWYIDVHNIAGNFANALGSCK